ncbi:TlpA family protein disulfide reductase [Aquimarina sp. 2201CG14-23]|uniref:TlpA family protein disulfide reductase n=1 Tax=Aquimarina mycalae TaxID=3040073 RepID=UPI00247829B5|nr:TlpA disulfide reductase family protein [Aquimarina sp. 2201CG14-23]MDH7445241.1 TlpA disulfide reductase family protein [Aquimarina sp. 2201CG14-23]
MKTLTALLISVITIYTVNAQDVYYRGSDGNIISEEVVKEQQQKLYEKFSKGNKTIVVDVDIKDTEVKQDSIIHDFGFHVDLSGRKKTKTKLESLKGKSMLESTLVSLDGDQISISELKGKPTLLNFWFTSCKPCIDEMPELNKLKEHFGNRVNFVAVTFESKEKVEKFLKKHDFDFKQVVDAKEYTDALEMNDFPKNIILDQNGLIKSIESGIAYIQGEDGELIMGEATALKNKLTKLLK